MRSLPPYPNDLPVWVSTGDRQIPGRIAQPANTPRSYVVDTQSGQVRRNHRDLKVHTEDLKTNPEPPRAITTRSRSGTIIKPPNRLTY